MTKLESTFEEMKVKSSNLVEKIKDLIEEGNARRVTIRKDDRVLLEFPLTVGVGGATAAILFAAPLAAVGALAALVSDVDVIVERTVSVDAEVVEEAAEEDAPEG